MLVIYSEFHFRRSDDSIRIRTQLDQLSSKLEGYFRLPVVGSARALHQILQRISVGGLGAKARDLAYDR